MGMLPPRSPVTEIGFPPAAQDYHRGAGDCAERRRRHACPLLRERPRPPLRSPGCTTQLGVCTAATGVWAASPLPMTS
eukprot:14446302-Alexandrium_andersonii.AAC.1